MTITTHKTAMTADALENGGIYRRLERRSGFLRSIAALVIVTFTMLVLAPTAVAARQYYNEYQQAAALIPGDEAKLSKAIQTVEELLTIMEAKQSQSQDTGSEQDALMQLRSDIEQLDRAVTANFATIAQNIRDKGLPAVIQQRQTDMETYYRTQIDTLLANLQAIGPAAGKTARKGIAEKRKGDLDAGSALQQLKENRSRRSQQPFDPNQLPNRSLKPDPNNKPKERPEAFKAAGLYNTPFMQVAALGGFTYDKLAGADDPAYLAASDEVTLSQPVKEKAAELDHNPVKIQNWVRNHIEWQPTWGAIQDADLTLAARRGNAMDIASLTLALLRASGIPARYVHGTVEVPAEKFSNWAGGFSNITAAAYYAASGGIPTTTVTTGGLISHIRLEHIWVEAAIDYHPSRGARNRAADSWVAMDPSYKQYEYLEGWM